MHSLLNSTIPDFDILLITEPWWASIGNNINGPTANLCWTPILPVAAIAADSRPRVMAYIRNQDNPTFSVTLRSDITLDLDIQILEVRQTPHPTTLLVNIYNPPRASGGLPDTPAKRLRLLDLPVNMPTILTGDWNLHHPMWSMNSTDTSTLADETVDWLNENSYTLMNEKGKATFFSHNGRSASTLDLTFINTAALEHDATQEWTIDESRSYGSDHYALRWKLNYGEAEIDNICEPRRNFKAADPEEWKDAFRTELSPHKAIFDKLRSADATSPEALDEAVDTFMSAMERATAQTVPPRKKSDKAKPWWTKEVAEANTRIDKQRALLKEHYQRWGEPDSTLKTQIKKSRNFFKRLYQRAKNDWLTETLKNAVVKDIWGFRKWSKGERTYPSPAIYRGPDQEPAVQHSDKCDALRDELFQPAPLLEGVETPNLTEHLPGDLPHEQTTRTEIREALFEQNPSKAPGPSQDTFVVIRWAWEAAEADIITIMQRCVDEGYHPKRWRYSIAIALRKPRKPDYSKPRAYRLIQLLECLGKVLERIIAVRLAYFVAKFNLVPATQFGGRPNSSTDDAVLTFINDVEAARNHDLVTSALTFDITGYFDFVNHDRLLTTMRQKGIPLPLVKWTSSFLSDRFCAISLDGIRDTMKPVINGIPQGSPVSPILSIIYAAELSEIFERRAHAHNNAGLRLPDNPTSTNLIMFIDDGKLYVSSKTLETNVQILKIAYLEVSRWLTSVGLSPDLLKRELMHYSWRQDKGHSPSISLPGANGNTIEIAAQETTKWLGVYFDRKLTFHEHVKTMAGRAETTINGLHMLANTVRGLSQSHLRTLYLSCALPVLTYGCPSWWTGKQLHVNTLERVQRRALRLICAVFKTTPIVALELEASVLPIRQALDLVRDRAAIRINKLSQFNPILQRLPPAWRYDCPAVPKPPLPTHKTHTTRKTKPPKTTRLCELAKRSSPINERITPQHLPPWRKTPNDYKGRLIIAPPAKGTTKKDGAKAHREKVRDLHHNPSYLLVYSDGSLMEHEGKRSAGAGIVAYHRGKRVFSHTVGLGTQAEVYDAELVALAYASRDATGYARIAEEPIRNLHFYADNTSAITTIFEPQARSGQQHSIIFRNTITKFLNRHPENRVEVSWSPGHENIKGNERADTLAKEATQMPGPANHATRSHALRRSKEAVYKTWTDAWKQTNKTGRFAIANRLPPATKPKTHFTTLKREVYGRVTQCRTGHTFTGEYYSHFVPSEPVDCPCGTGFQTRHHILTECDRYTHYRHILRKVSDDLSMPTILGTEEGISALAEFIEKSGAFTKTGNPRAPRQPIQEMDTDDDESNSEYESDPGD